MSESTSKIGGPYTEVQQEERRIKVYEMHFEKGMSAVAIGKELNVNRHTINKDIREWYTKVAYEVPEHDVSLLLKQIHRLEMQRTRLLEDIEECEDSKCKLALEKLLYNILSKITSETSKIVFSRNDVMWGLKHDIDVKVKK